MNENLECDRYHVIRCVFALTVCLVAQGESHAGDPLKSNVGQWNLPHQTQNQEQGNKPTVTDKPVKIINAELRRGFAQITSGHPQQSLTTFSLSLEEARRRLDRTSEAIALNGLSDAYLLLRQLRKAEHSANESVRLARQLNDAVLLGAALNHLGNVFTAEVQFSQALHTYQKALMHAERGADKLLGVKVRINMMHVHLENMAASQANTILRTTVSLAADLPNAVDKLYSLLALGYVAQRLKRQEPDKQDAHSELTYRLFSEALTLANELSDIRGRSYALGHLSELYTEQKRYTEAERLLLQAIFLAEQADAPEILGQWYWQLGRLRLTQGRENEAITDYERALAEFDSIQNALIYGRRGHPQSFRESAGLIYLEFSELLLNQAESAPGEEQRQTALRRIRDVMEEFKAVELKNYFQDYCVTAQQEKNKRLELDRLMEAGTATLYPVVFPNRTVLFLSLPDGRFKHFKVGVGARELSTTANRLRRQLTPSGNPRRLLKHAAELYDWLIRPISYELDERGIETLVIVPDDILRTIPFGALHNGSRYLVEDFALAITPGLRLTNTSGTSDQRRLLLGGVSESVQGFDELPHVQEEIDRIADVYSGTPLLDKAFLKNKVIQELERVPYSVISFSTHGFFHSNPKESFVLTYDDKLTIDELERFIRISEFRDQPVELIVLSACDTAIGDERAALGLAGVAVKAGARSAMASLWAVNDRSTAVLVPAFFEKLKDPKLSKAQALQQAQQKLLADPRTKHPYYWAPFVLIGNWF